MTNVVLAGAKYLIILSFALFVFISFLAQRDKEEERKKGTYFFQKILVLFIHVLSYTCLLLNAYTGFVSVDVKGLFILGSIQVAYLVFMLFVLPIIFHFSQCVNTIMLMLIDIGFIFQTRFSYDDGMQHLIYVAISTVILIAFQALSGHFRNMHKLTWAYCIAGLVLLLVVFVFARISYGAKTSIDLGLFSFQPFEFVKILFVLFVAAAFNRANSFKTVGITAIIAAVHIGIMVMCSELGTALILAIVYVLMIYVATKKIIYILAGTVGFAAACVAAYLLFAHVRVRVQVWIDPWSDIDNKGYQITQSLFGIGTGGWLGTGLYHGKPGDIPRVSNDFVFSAISEELGAIFAIFLIILCLCLVLAIFRIAVRISEPFCKLTAFGIGAAYGFQVFLTVGGAIKFIPSTGINLPFISSGGSSLLASLISIGIVQVLYIISEQDVKIERSAMEDRLILKYDADAVDELVDIEKDRNDDGNL